MEAKKDLQEKLDYLREMYEKLIPFDRLLGIEIDTLTLTDIKIRIDMREELIGNFIRGMLHGGVISSVLDLTGGLIASVELVKHLENVEPDEVARRVARVGTIDLRVDYLRAGKGVYFTASGTVLRKGNKVAVIRTELCNDQNLLIAAGTGTYLVG
ncbi:MAG: hypothetical protein BA862_08785 [Desulfobulbaceae bacterium S3730MH12]|nr:MAG: hypothetical protein BA866_07605 [Desulfobulbaceae bacterium S5133MH15]OEU55964.1 MAG: hypothetical protein BA862_08785 [Desulfobulbaceae bacterium S3730MH12]OEU82913.1 MAG: hypothetical protein BA873_16780 [Desulfobulbaceae bacterium C00003063]